MEDENEKVNCKICRREVKKTKIVMHLTRNKDCGKGYNADFATLKEEQDKARKKYQQNYQQKYQEKYQEVYLKKNTDLLIEKRTKEY